MDTKKGKIIAIIGAPATGKSTLIKAINEKRNIKVFMEGEENNLPDFVKENINKNINGLQTLLFFHNQSLGQYLEASKLQEKGEVVILDNFWFSNIFYLDIMLENNEERKLFEELIFFYKPACIHA